MCLLVALGLAACTDAHSNEPIRVMLPADGGTPPQSASEGDLGEGDVDGDDDSVPERELARIEREGAYVSWIDADEQDAPPVIALGSLTGVLPLIDPDLAHETSAVTLYLGLASAGSALPDSLRPFATDVELSLERDGAARAALRGEMDASRERFAARLAEALGVSSPDEALTALAGSCSAVQRAEARSAFGRGFSPTSDCGDAHLGFVTRSRDYYYCNQSGAQCHYPLGREDGATCQPTMNSCDYVVGTTDVWSYRGITTGSPNFVMNGYYMVYFAYNCSGNGPLRMRVRHAPDQAWSSFSVPVGTWQLRYRSTTNRLAQFATARDFVSYGLWRHGFAPGLPSQRRFEYQILDNTGSNDRGIFCADVERSLTMSPGNIAHCHPNSLRWCEGSNCIGSCWR